jgi:hypothetical protein
VDIFGAGGAEVVEADIFLLACGIAYGDQPNLVGIICHQNPPYEVDRPHRIPGGP